MMVASPTSSVQRMQAFDSLPAALRRAIAFGQRVYDPAEIAARIANGRNPETILRGLVRYDRRAHR
ncbi:hypothetical protein [Rhizobium sp. 768_B6_N1_8]|uniref:hypothetical protein n=1 Tax=unclassified Rhizobium TaxID=2613769 RepID=UPI003F285AF7